MEKDIKVIIVLGICSYIIDIYSGKNTYYKFCYNNYNVQIELLIHHILNIYAQFGWLSNTKVLLQGYVISCIILLCHWNTNNDRCILTEKINKKCNIPIEKPFRDILYAIGFKNLKYYSILHRIYIFVTGIIALYKLSKL
jgi:hypothetical protein